MLMLAQSKAKVFLIPLVASLATALWYLYPTEDVRQRAMSGFGDRSVPDDGEWLQPASVTTAYPQPISSTQWPIDFEIIESQFSRFSVNEAGELPLNATMATALQQAFLQLPAAPEELLDRVAVLLRKSFPGQKGAQLSALFRNYARYEQARSMSTAADSQEHSRGSADAAIAALNTSVELQYKFLGKQTALKLFGKQNAMTAYLLARRQVRADAALSQSDKQERLHALRQAYRDGGF